MKQPILSNAISTARSLVLAACLVWTAAPKAEAGGGPLCGSAEIVRAIVSEDDAVAQQSIAALRVLGQEGLDALFVVHGSEIAALRQASSQRQPLTAAQQRLRTAIDSASQQHDGFTSQLFWHTEMESAKTAAHATSRPILSLRLLGNLTDEYSCANSRFFRTMLYANTEISKHLRENYVLHWESVRPVPRVQIDFGNGRMLKRTLTGNSIHYVLDGNGAVIDALPGLYGPGAFLRGLASASEAAAKIASLEGDEKAGALRQHHAAQLDQTLERWAGDLSRAGMAQPAADKIPNTPSLMVLAKRRAALAAATTDKVWPRLAAMHLDSASLDTSSRMHFATLHPSAERAGALTTSKRVVEDPLLRAVRLVERTAAQDSLRNEYLLHTTFHEWMATGSAPASLHAVNEKVYAELFLTPSSDPWLGLAPADAYSALENDGRRESGTADTAQP